MPTYRLHYFPESGNSYKLALMLTLCGERFEPIWTDFGGGVTRTPEWRRDVNEMGEIPVLEVDGDRRTQTAPILLQLAKQYGRFGGETEQEQFELLRWLFSGQSQADRLHGDLSLSFARSRRLPTRTCSPIFAGGSTTSCRSSKGICRRMQFAIGERPTIADISMMAYLHYPADETGYDLAASHPAISAWLRRMAQLPGWKSAYDLLPGKRLTHYAK